MMLKVYVYLRAIIHFWSKCLRQKSAFLKTWAGLIQYWKRNEWYKKHCVYISVLLCLSNIQGHPCLSVCPSVRLSDSLSFSRLLGCLWKIEISIPGMAISSRHSLPTQPKSRKEKRAWLCNDQFQNRRHKQLTQVRTRGATALERSVAKQFATGGLNQVLGCTNLTLAPTGYDMNKQVHVALVK
jgi:hypothetical protein